MYSRLLIGWVDWSVTTGFENPNGVPLSSSPE